MVQASAWEISGLMSDQGYEGRGRLHPYPTLILFSSQIPNGGLGVFTWHGHPEGAFLTEYTGRVLDRAGATALKAERKQSHLLTLEKPVLFFDGRRLSDFGLTDEHYVHHHQVTVLPWERKPKKARLSFLRVLLSSYILGNIH